VILQLKTEIIIPIWDCASSQQISLNHSLWSNLITQSGFGFFKALHLTSLCDSGPCTWWRYCTSHCGLIVIVRERVCGLQALCVIFYPQKCGVHNSKPAAAPMDCSPRILSRAPSLRFGVKISVEVMMELVVHETSSGPAFLRSQWFTSVSS
jgi:hypothetical protein